MRWLLDGFDHLPWIYPRELGGHLLLLPRDHWLWDAGGSIISPLLSHEHMTPLGEATWWSHVASCAQMLLMLWHCPTYVSSSAGVASTARQVAQCLEGISICAKSSWLKLNPAKEQRACYQRVLSATKLLTLPTREITCLPIIRTTNISLVTLGSVVHLHHRANKSSKKLSLAGQKPLYFSSRQGSGFGDILQSSVDWTWVTHCACGWEATVVSAHNSALLCCEHLAVHCPGSPFIHVSNSRSSC